jgi:hypothetical protein
MLRESTSFARSARREIYRRRGYPEVESNFLTLPSLFCVIRIALTIYIVRAEEHIKAVSYRLSMQKILRRKEKTCYASNVNLAGT